MNVTLQHLDVMDIVRQHHDAAGRVHGVVVEVLGEIVPQLQRMVIEARAFVIEIIRADDGGVAAGIAAAQPALFDHGNVGDAVFLGEVIGGAETMPAGADDDDVVFRFRFGRGPVLFPAAVAPQGFTGDGEGRVFAHPGELHNRGGR
jgi:hypothetical protein